MQIPGFRLAAERAQGTPQAQGQSVPTPRAAVKTISQPHNDRMNRGGESGNDGVARATETTETTDDTGSEAEPTPPRRRRRRWLWTTLGALTAVLLLAGAAVGFVYWRTDQALSSIER